MGKVNNMSLQAILNQIDIGFKTEDLNVFCNDQDVRNEIIFLTKEGRDFTDVLLRNEDKIDKEKLVLISYQTFKEKLEDNDNEASSAVRYMYYMLQSMDNVPEIKYIMGYMAKSNCFIKPEEYKFDEDKQFIFEGILYSALTLYNNGGASKSKLAESHKRFIQEIEQKNEEKLTRTQQLSTVKIQALRELGYNDINADNASEVFEKMAEIQTRKV